MPARRILIVEDDADIRLALADAMRDAGAEVVVAADGLDALERLRAGPCPAVVLLDLRLPRLNGQAFLDELRADVRFERLPVITMTAGASRAEGDEIVARLHKPVDVDDLRRIVESLFDAAA
jgi:CheY-like chemotaxis protein